MLLCSILALIAAAAPPSPTPAPKISPTPLPSVPTTTAATVLIYPFDVQTGVDQKIGFAIAEILAQEMAAAGGLGVLPVPQGVKRTAFLDNARAQHADFYISGYVTPVGDAAAVVEQVVSVESGVILFSQTAQVQSVADVASQSLQARAQILAFVGRGTQNIAEQSTNTPAPTASNGAQMQIRGISGIVNSVFHHKGATPSPTPVTKPDRGMIIAPVTAAGGAGAADIANATNELFFSMQRHYNVQLTAATSSVEQSANAICGASRNNTIATGTLTESTPPHGKAQAVFTLSVYTCFGAVLDHAVGKADSFRHAVDAAVATYVTAHPNND